MFTFNKNSLSNIDFIENGTENILDNIDPSKACGHEMITIHKLKICATSICKLIETVYKLSSNRL